MRVLDENEFFRQATLRIFSSLNIETAMKRCMDYLKTYMPCSGMFFGLYDPDLNIGRILVSIWPAHLRKPNDTIPIQKEYWSWMRERWAGEPRVSIVNDFDVSDPPLGEILAMFFPPDTSLISMMLELENKRLGTLNVFAQGKHRYVKSHADLISLLHEPFAIAISNILQHQEILRLQDMVSRRQPVSSPTDVGNDRRHHHRRGFRP